MIMIESSKHYQIRIVNVVHSHAYILSEIAAPFVLLQGQIETCYWVTMPNLVTHNLYMHCYIDMVAHGTALDKPVGGTGGQFSDTLLIYSPFSTNGPNLDGQLGRQRR